PWPRPAEGRRPPARRRLRHAQEPNNLRSRTCCRGRRRLTFVPSLGSTATTIPSSQPASRQSAARSGSHPEEGAAQRSTALLRGWCRRGHTHQRRRLELRVEDVAEALDRDLDLLEILPDLRQPKNWLNRLRSDHVKRD